MVNFEYGNNVRRVTISAEYLFVGGKFKTKEDFVFSAIKFSLPNLLSCLVEVVTGLNKEVQQNESGQILKFGSSAKHSSKIIYETQLSSYGFVTKVHKYACLYLKGTIDFDDAIAFTSRFKGLFLFLVNNQNSLTNIECEAGEKVIKVYYRPSMINNTGYIYPLNISFNVGRKDLAAILERWYQNKDIYQYIELILEKTFNNQLSLDLNFLNICFAIESYHRNYFKNELYDVDAFESWKQEVRKLENLDAKLKKLICEKLEYANEPSFRKRLKDFSKFYSQVAAYIYRKEKEVRDEITGNIVDTRNALVHQLKGKPILKGNNLFGYTKFIELMLRSELYEKLGFDRGTIDANFSQYLNMVTSNMFAR